MMRGLVRPASEDWKAQGQEFVFVQYAENEDTDGVTKIESAYHNEVWDPDVEQGNVAEIRITRADLSDPLVADFENAQLALEERFDQKVEEGKEKNG